MTRTHSKAFEMASLPHLRFRDLRHTHASILLDSGVPVVQVSKCLRHKRPSTTLGIYYDPDDRKIDDLGKAFNEAVCGGF
ncbi:MAG: tyrosine-type recombinase/integrase [Clostridiales bacterium]|nr:tyrosine-type recombinase/integrase [Clostridiales bacterium]